METLSKEALPGKKMAARLAASAHPRFKSSPVAAPSAGRKDLFSCRFVWMEVDKWGRNRGLWMAVRWRTVLPGFPPGEADSLRLGTARRDRIRSRKGRQSCWLLGATGGEDRKGPRL